MSAPSPWGGRWREAATLAVAVGLGLLVAGPFCFAPIRETDAGWHLALGRLIDVGGIPSTNRLSWTAPDFPWYPTSWLYDWVAFRLTAAFGLIGLQGLTCALLALTLLGIALACRQVARGAVWLTPLAALLLLPRVTERPHLASWALLAAVVVLGQRGREGGWGFRAACVPLIALGSNLHAGAVFAALVLAGYTVEAFERERRWREWGVAVAGLLALAANPGGTFNVFYVLGHMQVGEVIRLQDLERPGWPAWAAFYALVPLAVALALGQRRRWPALLFQTVVFAALGLFAVRLASKFVVVAFPALALLFAPPWRRWVGWVTVVALSGLALWAGRYDLRVAALHRGARFDERALATRAAGYLSREAVDGRGFNSFRDGGLLAWLRPEVGVFQDGRVQAWPADFWRELQQAERSPALFRGLLDEWGVDYALTLRRPERLGGFRSLDAPAVWALVYWDETSELFLRREVARFAPLIARDEYRLFRPYGAIVGPVAGTAREGVARYEAEVLRYRATAPEDPFAAIVWCALGRRGERPDADQRCEQARQRAQGTAQRRLAAEAAAVTAAP